MSVWCAPVVAATRHAIALPRGRDWPRGESKPMLGGPCTPRVIGRSDMEEV